MPLYRILQKKCSRAFLNLYPAVCHVSRDNKSDKFYSGNPLRKQFPGLGERGHTIQFRARVEKPTPIATPARAQLRTPLSPKIYKKRSKQNSRISLKRTNSINYCWFAIRAARGYSLINKPVIYKFKEPKLLFAPLSARHRLCLAGNYGLGILCFNPESGS